MKITDKEKTEFLLKLAKEHYSQGDDYHAFKSKKYKWHFGHSNDHELQHGQGNNTIIDDSMLEILMNREVVNTLPIAVVRRSADMISEQFQYRGFTFQRMTKDARWYVCYANQIVNWGQYQNDLKEWVDGNYS